MELELRDFDSPDALQTRPDAARAGCREGVGCASRSSRTSARSTPTSAFKQVLLNLVTNAVKFTPRAGPS